MIQAKYCFKSKPKEYIRNWSNIWNIQGLQRGGGDRFCQWRFKYLERVLWICILNVYNALILHWNVAFHFLNFYLVAGYFLSVFIVFWSVKKTLYARTNVNSLALLCIFVCVYYHHRWGSKASLSFLWL